MTGFRAIAVLFALGVAALPALALAQNTRPASCNRLSDFRQKMEIVYGPRIIPLASPELAEGLEPEQQAGPPNRLDRTLLDTALASYEQHECGNGQAYAPSQIIIVDFARASSEPRLYSVDLLSGYGIDTPVHVAHGIGSDPDDNGIADRFSNASNSFASSLGAARGAELYVGANGLSLRLDGLDPSNSAMRARDIVAHSYQAERRRYFNASYLGDRAGKPGTSEGCFVVAPNLRDWLFSTLSNGGFLFAGLGGERAQEMYAPTRMPPYPVGN
jgi:L,D-transpeptidase catalytic domain